MIDGMDAIGQLGAAFFTPPGSELETRPDPAKMVDVVDFEKAMSAGEVGSSPVDSGGVLQLGGSSGGTTVGASGLAQNVMSGLSELDGGYREITERITDWPSFSSYLESHGVGAGGASIDQDGHISNIDEVLAREVPDTPEDLGSQVEQAYRSLDAHQRSANEFYAAGLEYQQDSATWFLGTEFWLTKVKVLTSAVTQVSSGLKTLFMSQ